MTTMQGDRQMIEAANESVAAADLLRRALTEPAGGELAHTLAAGVHELHAITLTLEVIADVMRGNVDKQLRDALVEARDFVDDAGRRTDALDWYRAKANDVLVRVDEAIARKDSRHALSMDDLVAFAQAGWTYPLEDDDATRGQIAEWVAERQAGRA